jgi:hypothetical protein
VTIRIEPGTQPLRPYVYRGTGADTLTGGMTRRHLRYGEKPCGECRRAQTQSRTERRQAARKQAAA